MRYKLTRFEAWEGIVYAGCLVVSWIGVLEFAWKGNWWLFPNFTRLYAPTECTGLEYT